MSLSSATAGWIAIGAAAGAIVVALLVLLVWLEGRRSRGRKDVLAGSNSKDLVDFAIGLQGQVDDLHRAVDEIAAAIARVDRRLDTTLGRTAIVRYDAYEATGGRQSASVALLDANRSGVVLSAIQGRDYARVYVKELEQGKASVALSPEEQQAVERAMSRA